MPADDPEAPPPQERPTAPMLPTDIRRNRASLLQTVVNPFENQSPWTGYEIFKAVLLGPTLLVVRMVVLIWCQISMSIFCRLAVLGSSAKLIEDRGCIRHSEPLSRWRYIFLVPVIFFNRAMLWCLGFWHIRIVDHRKNRRELPNIIVGAPHMNPVDPFVLAWAFPPLPSGVGKKELLSGVEGFLMGPMAIAGQGIFVDRDSSESRLACKEAIARRADPSWTGASTMIFPEGTTTNGRALIQFKNGPFSPGKPVLPVLLKYPAKHLNIAWVGDCSNLGMLVLRMMMQFVNYCEIEILDVYTPSPEEVADQKLFAKNVRKVMAEKLGVSTTEHSYADLKLSLVAIKYGVGNDFHVDEMVSRYGVDLDQLKGWLRDFRKIDKDGSGTISYAEFRQVMAEDKAMPHSAKAMERMFSFFDTDQTGQISYREFVQGLALLSGRCTGTARAKLCFLLCDTEGTGQVAREMLRETLHKASTRSDPAHVDALVDTLPEEVGLEEFSAFAEGHPELLSAVLQMEHAVLSPASKGVAAAAGFGEMELPALAAQS